MRIFEEAQNPIKLLTTPIKLIWIRLYILSGMLQLTFNSGDLTYAVGRALFTFCTGYLIFGLGIKLSTNEQTGEALAQKESQQ